jgi:hypothetical protein
VRIAERLLNSIDNARINGGSRRLRAQCPLVGKPDVSRLRDHVGGVLRFDVFLRR